MSRLYNILNAIVNRTKVVTETLTSSNWTATGASFQNGTLTKCGNARTLYLMLKTTAAMADGTEFTFGTLKLTGLSGVNSAVGVHIFGAVTVNDLGVVKSAPYRSLASGNNCYIKLTWIGGGSV